MDNGKLYIILCVFVILIKLLSSYTKRIGFKDLIIHQEIDKKVIRPGEKFRIITRVENHKRFPLSFVVLDQRVNDGIKFYTTDHKSSLQGHYTTCYNLRGRERVTKIVETTIEQRGVYLLQDMTLSIGDFLGLSKETRTIHHNLEILVYPKLIQKLNGRHQNNILGDDIINRLLFKDNLFIRGVRDYSFEDSMKDIHWKATSRMNKLMVKDYEYITDKEVVIILNTECGTPHWKHISPTYIEQAISYGATMSRVFIKRGVKTGLWTNAHIMNYRGKSDAEVEPVLNENILFERYARINYMCNTDFFNYLSTRLKMFKPQRQYIIISCFMDEASEKTVKELNKKGISVKTIYLSAKGEVITA